MYRYDLTDAQWERIAPFFPDRFHRGRAGHPWKDHRPLVNGILWHLHTGAPWPDTPERYGPWQTVYDRFNRCAPTAPGPGSSTPFCSAWTRTASSSATCGASTPPSSAPPGRRRGGKKIPTRGPPWAAPRRCNARNPKAMRWGVRRAASAPRPT